MATRFARIGPQYLEHFSFNMHRVHFPLRRLLDAKLALRAEIAEPIISRQRATDAIVHHREVFVRDA